jgi:hypothetical protein
MCALEIHSLPFEDGFQPKYTMLKKKKGLQWYSKSDDVGFNPCTQRHYRRLIYYIYKATCFGRTTIIRVENILLP